jgi:hypothetical protein
LSASGAPAEVVMVGFVMLGFPVFPGSWPPGLADAPGDAGVRAFLE